MWHSSHAAGDPVATKVVAIEKYVRGGLRSVSDAIQKIDADDGNWFLAKVFALSLTDLCKHDVMHDMEVCMTMIPNI
jgi:hypothetical protein